MNKIKIGNYFFWKGVPDSYVSIDEDSRKLHQIGLYFGWYDEFVIGHIYVVMDIGEVSFPNLQQYSHKIRVSVERKDSKFADYGLWISEDLLLASAEFKLEL